MTSSFILDAHVLLWFLEGNPRLSDAAREAISSPDATLVIPSITLAEIFWAIGKQRVDLASEHVENALLSDKRFQVIDLDLDIVREAKQLFDLIEMHDAIVIATTLVRRREIPDAVLITKDAKIIASGIVPTLW